MSSLVHWQDGLRSLTVSLSARAGEQLKSLLETKHLYQKVSINAGEEVERIFAEVVGGHREVFRNEAGKRLRENLVLSTTQLYIASRDGGVAASLALQVDNVKVFCAQCDRREAFSPIHYYDVANELVKRHSHGGSSPLPPPGFQLFVLIYLCQGCKKTFQGFIVRRQNWDLILEGRSPMEQVEVPAFIPRRERRLFRDAMIAIHGGKPLAALFYLRAFTEQFARRVTGLTGKVTGEAIMTAYNETLP
jgi:hypothetical protein